MNNVFYLLFVMFFCLPCLMSAQNNTITIGRQFNFWKLQARNIHGGSQNIKLSDKRTGGEVGFMVGYQRNFRDGLAAWVQGGFGNSFGPIEEFKINPPIPFNADRTFDGMHLITSQAGYFQLSAGASKKIKILKHLRIGTTVGIGRQWHDAAVDHELTTVYLDQNQEPRVFSYGSIKGKNPENMPYFLLGGFDIILFEGNFNIIFGGQFQYFLSDLYRTEALTLMDGNGLLHTLAYDNAAIGWLINLKASYSF